MGNRTYEADNDEESPYTLHSMALEEKDWHSQTIMKKLIYVVKGIVKKS